MPSSILAEEMENDISSEVITLRPYKESDADDFLGYAGDDQVTRFTRWNTFSCKEEALVYIKDFCIPHPYCRSICVNDRSIGFVFIRQESGDDKCRAELGYAMAAKYWGQGVTTRALKMAISDGLRSFPDLVRLQARVDVENKASQRVLEKLGFLKEGVLRKYMYNKAIGFFMRFEDDSVESAKIVKQWNVKIISISKNKRHQDRAAALEVWDRLEEFVRSQSHT